MKLPLPRYKLERDSLELYFGRLTFCLYWPKLLKKIGRTYTDPAEIEKNDPYTGTRTEVGVLFPTTILYTRPRDGWSWSRAIAFFVLGFGFGLAWQHCNNPNLDKDAKVSP